MPDPKPVIPGYDDFVRHVASITDETERARLFARVKMNAVNIAPKEAFKPDVASLRDYLAKPIPTPPSLVWPTIVVRGEITTTLGRAGKGKAVPVTSGVLTPHGWRAMGDITLGDQVSDPNGEESFVEGVYPQGERDVFSLRFSDGSECRADGEHLWVFCGQDRRITTLEAWQLINAGVDLELPPISPVTYSFNSLYRPIDPYVLGLLLGDGGFSGNCTFSSKDEELVRAVEVLGGVNLVHTGYGCDYRINSSHFKDHLRAVGLAGSNSHTKCIPEAYLRASYESRLELLRGLLDSDGSPRLAGAEYVTVSASLAANVRELVISLGGRIRGGLKATCWPRADGSKGSSTAHYLRLDIPGVMPFKLKRKAALYRDPKNRRAKRLLVSIEPDGREDCKCIAVSATSRMFITDGMIPTSNTTMNLNRIFAWAAGRSMFPGWFAKDGQEYLKPDGPLRTLIAENEGNAGMFHQKMGMMLHQGPLSEPDKERALENIWIHGDGGYSGLKLDNDEGVRKLRAAVEEAKPDIVFIEPFRSLWSGEENSSTDMAVVVDNMVAMATDFGCGVILSHHERKSGAGDDGEKMSAGRGSTVLEGVVAVMENFESVKDGAYREMTWSKARYLPPPTPVRMEYNRENGWYDWVPSNVIDDGVLAAITEANDEPLNLSALSEEMGESQAKLRPVVARLVEAKKIVKMRSHSGQGGSTGFRYRLPSEATGSGGLSI